MAEHLRFSPDILRRLGEELVPQLDQGIVELVRNSYDADAVHCHVEITGANQVGGLMQLWDDGVGMTREDIRSGWLVLGRSTKPGRRLTSLGRRTVGEKGLGRLAALRMGNQVSLATRPRAEPGKEYQLTIDWRRYDDTQVVEDVPLEIIETTASQPPGTSIEIRELLVPFGRDHIELLARSLILLADPFDDNTGFHPQLISPEFIDLQRRVKAAYFGDAVLYLTADIDERGRAKASVYNARTRSLKWTASHSDITRNTGDVYATAPASFELWSFSLDGRSFMNRSASLNEVKRWLDIIGGVHLYHRGLRVYPYGDEGHDWLDMNLLRSRNPEFRPSTNNSIGRVVVPDPDQLLTQKTDRTGFLETPSFIGLRRFTRDSLEWMAAGE